MKYCYKLNTELYHYGIKGMKWGVRRYRNYDGSLTKAGLDRYDHSVSIYEKRKSEYDSRKKAGFNSNYEKRLAKAKVKEAKSQVKKDYKHLKQDKLADEGKVLFKSGARIKGNSAATNLLQRFGGLALVGSAYAYKKGFVDSKTAAGIAAAGAIATGASYAKRLIDEIPNRKLRAYYAHTSNY